MSEEIDPSEFVQRIRQLGEQRDQQDAERVKKLEQDLIQGRSERLARRAERARSISPDKPSTPQSLRSAAETPRTVQEKAASTPTPTPAMSPPPQDAAREESLQRLTSSPAPTALDDTEPKKPATSAAALGRSGTLSWKQRPQSGSMRRPLSMASRSPERSAATSPRDTPEPSSPEQNPSRSSIAASLGAKDPTWFRQTPDRGAGSAAFRKNQDDNASDVDSISGKRQLPGMSRESTIEPEISSPPPESLRSSSPGSRGGSARGSAMLSNRFSTNTSISGGDAESIAKTRSPLPVLDSQKFAPPSEPASSVDGGDSASAARGLAMSPTQGRISPERERPASPTKGMGGFVQSAMLKRSDSVSKRWSTQTPPGLSRQNSTLSNRGSAMAGYGTLSKMERPTTLSRDNSMEPSSRPTSSHSNATILPGADKDSTPKDVFVKPALPHHSRSKSVASTYSEKDQPQDDTSPPSPSKRWSPTKSSWLESALSKPDSPKPKQPPPAQPAWMAEINRIKQQRSSVDLGKGSPFQSPSGEAPGSGRTSPIKDIQLKPVGLRRSESPTKEAPVQSLKTSALAEPASKPKPIPSPKPSVTQKEDVKPLEEAPTAKVEPEDPVAAPEPVIKEDPLPTSSKAEPPKSAAKDTPVPVSDKPATSRYANEPPRAVPAVKTKPGTPPKKDFRAGLKSRQPIGDSSKKDEVNEFQNVFGKLRKAETKNYVAPDLLKDNITRGKNALNLTGGPKPTVRRDDFRESLLSKKTAMLEKAKEEGSALKRTDSSSQPATTPEAIARKKSLREIKPVVEQKPAQPTPSFAAKEPAISSKLAGRFNPALAGMLARGPPPLATNKSTSSADGDVSPTKPAQEEKSGPAPELQHMTKGRARGPKRRAPATNKAAVEPEKSQEKVPAATTSTTLVKPEHVLPSSEPSKTNGPSDATPVTKTPARQSIAEKPATPAKSTRVASGNFGKTSTPEPPKKPSSLELERRVSGSQAIPKKSPRPESIQSPKPSSPGVPKKPASLENDRRVSGSQNTPQKSPLPKPISTPKPAETPKSVDMAKPMSPSSSPAVSQSRFSRPLPTPPVKPVAESQRSTPLKEISPPNVEISPAKDEPSPEKSSFSSVRNATSLWGRQSASSSPVPARTKSPIKLPTEADEEAAMKDAGLVRSPELQTKPLPGPPQPKPQSPTESKPLPPKPKPAGLGFSLGTLGGYMAARSRESSPQPPTGFPASPPGSAGRPQSDSFKASPAPPKHDGMFADFFDEAPVTDRQLPENIDTVQILRSPPLDLGPAGKIRTLRKQIQEVTGDGKLSPIPMQEEHVLFQDSMYLCTHVYGDSKGARHTDVYLWAGNGIAEPTLEDAQLFAKNHAKQNQGRLLVVRQGQEPPNFFEALGGIVITRRGTNPASKEFMLCGRRHLGHLAFDEVDFSLKSLCSAFPYLVSTSAGKVYLWKGRGCSAEELSGARLMGMDLAPTGDFSEIDEGAEPQDFVQQTFPPPATPTKGPAIPRSADHWRYKSTSDKYRPRLFRIEQHSGQNAGWGQALQVSSSFFAQLRRPSWSGPQAEQRPQTPVTPKTPGSVRAEVKEVMPFCQRDLEPEHIYVLDAFFEMYIIIGPLSRTQSHAFSTALLFAQEYSILAVSEEDRPFMPVTTVVLEGVPRDMKAVFRHWDDRLIPAAGLMSGKLGRGKSLRIVGLEKALEGTRRLV
ncbi:Nn.00g006400.m01.CDS01 [Neocucurbitaria sp. VM-36]